MKKAKSLLGSKPVKQAHSSGSKFGMGDNYGTGNKNPMGRMIDGIGMQQISKSKIKKPPRSLA